MMTPLRAPLALRAIVVAAGLVVAAALPIAAQSAAQAPSPQTATPLPTVKVTARSGMSDSLRVELAGHIADSVTLAQMSARQRVLRLMDDNRYLESVRADQDRRIEALEQRIKALAAERARIRASAAATATPDSIEAPSDSTAKRAPTP